MGEVKRKRREAGEKAEDKEISEQQIRYIANKCEKARTRVYIRTGHKILKRSVSSFFVSP